VAPLVPSVKPELTGAFMNTIHVVCPKCGHQFPETFVRLKSRDAISCLQVITPPALRKSETLRHYFIIG